MNPLITKLILEQKSNVEISSNDKKNEVYESVNIANEDVNDLVEITDPLKTAILNQ
jgi:hypothetical protein